MNNDTDDTARETEGTSRSVSDETRRFLEKRWHPTNIEVEGDTLVHMSVRTEDGEVFEFDGEMGVSSAGHYGAPHGPE